MESKIKNRVCECGSDFYIAETYEIDYAILFLCKNCSNSYVEIKECVHDFVTYKVTQANQSIHVMTKCSICFQHKETHKKHGFELDLIPHYNPKNEEEFNNRLAFIRIKFKKSLNIIRLKRKKETSYWNIENWYIGYLQSSMWKRQRELILRDRNYKCERCQEVAIIIHHKTYERVGYELPEDLMAVCLNCHDKEHLENPDLNVVSQFRIHEI